MIEPGATVAGHRVERLLGDNALTSTWLVRAASGEPRVLRTVLLFLPAYQERFRRSCGLLVGVDHPHLLRVLEVVDVDGLPAVLVEHVDGGHLGEWITRGPHPPGPTVRMLRGLLAGVGAAHGLGLLHRNLKPTSVLLARGVPKVDDFALGKVTVADDDDPNLTQTGTTFGTPQYMAPEQFRGAQLADERTDLYAVGAMAYEMCAGRRAFEGTDVGELYLAVRDGRCTPLASLRPDLPARLVRLIEDLMRPDPDERPASAQVVLDRIDADPELSELAARGGELTADPNAATLPPTRALLKDLGVDQAAPTLPPTAAPLAATPAPAPPAPAPAPTPAPAPAGPNLPLLVGIGAVVVIVGLAAAFALS